MKRIIPFLVLLAPGFVGDADADNYSINIPGVTCGSSGWLSTPASNTGVTIQCASGGPPPAGAPTGCVAKANGGTSNVALPTAGGNVNFTVACTSPTSGITWNWSENGTYNKSTSNAWTRAFSSNASTANDLVFSYQVQACAGTPCVVVPLSPLLVTVAKSGGGGFNGTCPGYANTRVINMDWNQPSGTRLYTRNYGGFGVNDIIVAKFTTPGTSSGNGGLPSWQAAEYDSPPSSRTAVVSTTPCNLTASGTNIAVGNSVTLLFALGTGTNYGYYPTLPLNTVHYVNMINNPGSTCASAGSCDMFVTIIKPGGTMMMSTQSGMEPQKAKAVAKKPQPKKK